MNDNPNEKAAGLDDANIEPKDPMWILIRYAGRTLTEQIREVAARELNNNQMLNLVEKECLEETMKVCNAWLGE